MHQLHDPNNPYTNNNNNIDYNSTYDKDTSDQNLYVSSNFAQTMQQQTETAVTSTSCTTAPPLIFLFVTLLITTGATAMLCAAIMSDHWEHISWDRAIVDKMTRNTSHAVQWHLNGKVGRIDVSRKYLFLVYGGKVIFFLLPFEVE